MTNPFKQTLHNVNGQSQFITVVGECELIEHLFGKDWWNNPECTYEEQTRRIMAWVKKFNAHYYARPRESYFQHEALEETIAAGKRIVVCCDMS